MPARFQLRLAGLAGLLAVSVGCVPKLTPQQDWVITNFEGCETETGAFNANLARVLPDGSFTVEMAQTQTDYNRIIACMRARAEKERAGTEPARK